MAGNQYKPDPRQAEFLINYLDTSSETFGNALQSALKAGYAQEYAENITHLMPDWLSERIGDESLITKAEGALLEALGYTSKDETGKVDAGVGRLKLDAAKLVLKGMKKEKYSERYEHTGKDGETLVFQISSEVANKNGINTQTKRDSP